MEELFLSKQFSIHHSKVEGFVTSSLNERGEASRHNFLRSRIIAAFGPETRPHLVQYVAFVFTPGLPIGHTTDVFR